MCTLSFHLLAQMHSGLRYDWNAIDTDLQKPVLAFLLCAAFSAEGRSLEHERFEE